MPPRFAVEITASAERDLGTILEHISRDNRRAALAWVRALRRKIGDLKRFPFRCPIIPESTHLGLELRHLIHGDYRIVHRVAETTVIVLRVIHGAKQLLPPP